MNKETIGKVQLWIGIILLIVGIVGVIVSISTINSHQSDNYGVLDSEDDFAKLKNSILNSQSISTYTLAGLIIGLTSILTVFLSLLFITQGIANKSEN